MAWDSCERAETRWLPCDFGFLHVAEEDGVFGFSTESDSFFLAESNGVIGVTSQDNWLTRKYPEEYNDVVGLLEI